MKSGFTVRACSELLQAWQLKRHFQIAVNLGIVELRLGRHRDAAEHILYFLRKGEGVAEEEIRQAEEMLREARRHVGALVVEVEPDGAEVFVDGRPAGDVPLGGELFVEPGLRVVEVRCARFEPARRVIGAEAGASHRVRVALSPRRPTESIPIHRDGAGDRTNAAPASRPVYWPAAVAAGLSLAGVGLGVGFTIAANEKDRDAEAMLREAVGAAAKGQNACPAGGPPSPTCSALARLLEDKDRDTDAAVAGYVVGGAAALGAAALLIWPVRVRQPGFEVRVTPATTLHGGGLRFEGSF